MGRGRRARWASAPVVQAGVRRSMVLAAWIAAGWPDTLHAQVGAMAIVGATRASPALLGREATEGYVTQPNLMVTASRGSLAVQGAVNVEGITLRRGELNAGSYGEGYVDRRHPHTLLHEAMASLTSPARRGLRASLAVGKGFTPFGTDDPMMRPFMKYPVNHHHAQVIERGQLVGAVEVARGTRRMVLEHAVFNGDEPVDPFTGPQWSRVGDSRATRLTVQPAWGIEWQASTAMVASPGIIQGGAFDHRQHSLSLRIDRPGAQGARRYALVEWARTDEMDGPRRAFRFGSVLAEGQWEHRRWRAALRGERTDRPEPERLLDPFRTPAGHIDTQIVGITRWAIVTAQLQAPPVAPWRGASARLLPFLEVGRAVPTAQRRPAVFEPVAFYGAPGLWSLSAGVRVHVGTMRSRMGRYGVLAEPAAHHHH